MSTRAASQFGFASLDLRSLALARVTLGVCMLWDLSGYLGHAREWLSDAGVLPRWAVIQHSGGAVRWSLFFIDGHPVFAGLLLAASMVASIAFIVGYRTRLAAVLCWVACISVDARNPFLGSSGELLLRMLFFWFAFLPSGAVYSFDSAMHTGAQAQSTSPRPFSDFASLGLLVQIACVYMFTAALKRGATWHQEASAVYYALHVDYLARPWTRCLWAMPGLLKALTSITLWAEWFCPLVLFLPAVIDSERVTRFVRLGACSALIVFHMALVATFELGRFPWICIAAWCALLPDLFWTKIESFTRRPIQYSQIFYDGECGFCFRMARWVRTFLAISEMPIVPAQHDHLALERMIADNSWVVRDESGQLHTCFDAWLTLCRLSPIGRWFVPLLSTSWPHRMGTALYRWVASHRAQLGGYTRCLDGAPAMRLESESPKFRGVVSLSLCVVMVVTVAVNIAALDPISIKLPRVIESGVQALRLDQRWSMFAPDPPRARLRLGAVGELSSHREIDLFRNGRPFSMERTVGLHEVFTDVFGIKWAEHLTNPEKHKWMRPHYAAYLCRRWNRSHSNAMQIKRIKLYTIRGPDFPPPKRKNQTGRIVHGLLIDHACGQGVTAAEWGREPGLYCAR